MPFVEMLQPMPGPTEVLSKICEQFLSQNIAALIYITNSEKYGRETVASQYFLELAKYVGIPVISWNADNSALEQVFLIYLHIKTLQRHVDEKICYDTPAKWR